MKDKRKIVCPKCETVVEYHRDSTKRWIGTIIGGAGGAVGGGFLGSSVGIALLGTAISGLWPIAFVGGSFLGMIGHAIGKRIEIVECPYCKANLKMNE